MIRRMIVSYLFGFLYCDCTFDVLADNSSRRASRLC